MVDGFEVFHQHTLGIGDVTEGDRTFLEISFTDLSVHNFVHQRGDAFFREVLERTGGGFHGVTHHDDGLFASEGVGTGILEDALLRFLLGMFVLPLYIEVASQGATVMSADEVFDDFGKMIFVCEAESFVDMTDDDVGRLLLGQFVVGIDAGLILSKKSGIEKFSNVMVHGSGSCQLWFRPNLVRHLCGEVSDLQRVDEGALRHF